MGCPAILEAIADAAKDWSVEFDSRTNTRAQTCLLKASKGPSEKHAKIGHDPSRLQMRPVGPKSTSSWLA